MIKLNFVTLKAAPGTEVRILERTHGGEDPAHTPPNMLLARMTSKGEIQTVLPGGYWVVLAEGYTTTPLQLDENGGQKAVILMELK